MELLHAGRTVTTRRRPSSTSRSERLSSSFLSWPEGSIWVELLRALLASRAASRVRSRAVMRFQSATTAKWEGCMADSGSWGPGKLGTWTHPCRGSGRCGRGTPWRAGRGLGPFARAHASLSVSRSRSWARWGAASGRLCSERARARRAGGDAWAAATSFLHSARGGVLSDPPTQTRRGSGQTPRLPAN